MDKFILCPLNANKNDMNERLIDRLQGEETISYSVENSTGYNEYEDVPIEFLNGFDYPGFPKH